VALAPAGLYPAIKINLEAVSGQESGWQAAAVWSVIFCAICFELVHRVKSWKKAAALAAVGLILLLSNCQTAIENSANHTGGISDERSHQAEAKADAKRQVAELEARRRAQADIAKEETAAAIDSEITERKARDATLWRRSNECSPELISAGATKDFCGDIAKLGAKRAAAAQRDRLDGQIEEKRRIAGAEAPSVADPGVEQIVRLMKLFGMEDNERNRSNAAFIRDCRKGIVLEILGAVSIFLVCLFFSFVPKWSPEKDERAEGSTAEVIELNARKVARTIGQKMPPKDRNFVALFMLVRQGDTKGRFQSTLALCGELPGGKKVYEWLPEWQKEGWITIEGGNRQPITIDFTRDGMRKVESMHMIKYV